MNWQNTRLQKRLQFNLQTLEAIYQPLVAIEAARHGWKFSKQIIPKDLASLTFSVIVTSTGASNRIENNPLSDKEVEQIYLNLDRKQFKGQDAQEVAGYLTCLEQIFECAQDIVITESYLLQLHQTMLSFSEKDTRHSGHYKFSPNRVEAHDHTRRVIGVLFEPTPPYLVKKEVQELIAWYHWAIDNKANSPLIVIANFIFEYLAIHPFQDGNGRISRLLTNLMLLQQGYEFVRVVSHEQLIETHKVAYYRALHETQKTWKRSEETILLWLKFFLNITQRQSEAALKRLEQDSIETLLSEKQLAVWQWAKQQDKAFSREEAVTALGFPQRTIEACIKKLVQLKQLKKLGEGRATRYTSL